MARNRRAPVTPAVQADGDIHTDPHAEQPGGSMGVTDMPMLTEVGGAKIVGSAVAYDPPPVIRIFRVTRGASVMYGGYRATIHVGKEFPETAYDIDVLTKQGVVLEDITPQPPTPVVDEEPEQE